MINYILEGHEAKPVDDVIAWANWFGTADRRVALDIVGEKRVSTVFLGIDHNWHEPPLLFETMVFRGDSAEDEICERYTTWAEAGHHRIVAELTRDG